MIASSRIKSISFNTPSCACLPLGHVSRIIDSVDHRAVFDTLDFKTKAPEQRRHPIHSLGPLARRLLELPHSRCLPRPGLFRVLRGAAPALPDDSHGCFWNKIPWILFSHSTRNTSYTFFFLVYWGYASHCPVNDNCDFRQAAHTYAEYNYASDQIKLGKCSKGTMESLSAGRPGSNRRQRRLHCSLDCLLIKQEGVGPSDNFSSCFHHLDYREKKQQHCNINVTSSWLPFN